VDFPGEIISATAEDDPDFPSVLSATCSIPECPEANILKECVNSDICTDTEIDFTITVSNPGPIPLDQCTVSDPDCLGADQMTGPIGVGGSATLIQATPPPAPFPNVHARYRLPRKWLSMTTATALPMARSPNSFYKMPANAWSMRSVSPIPVTRTWMPTVLR
jgi:hypothetical protein